MIGDHVAECSRLFVVTGATADSASLSGSYLDIFDVVAVPDRLEHRVDKAKDKNVLNRIFAEIMIDAINLTLFEYCGNGCVQLFCRFQIAPEGFFNHNPAPMLTFLRQSRFAEAAHDFRKERRRRREIEDMILA